jgi:hypothetical protein
MLETLSAAVGGGTEGKWVPTAFGFDDELGGFESRRRLFYFFILNLILLYEICLCVFLI